MPATPFCHTHCQGWRRASRPDPGEFATARADPGLGCEWIDVRCLPGRLRLEIQYVLQCRGDERQSWLRPVTVQQILRDLAATGAASLLERTEEEWAEPGPRGIRARGGRQFILDARARIEQLAFGSGWEVEYPRDKWRLRNLGIQPGKEVAAIDFAPVSQPWLAALAKCWCWWRLSAGLSAGEAAQGIRVIRRFSAFLAAHVPSGGPASIDRPLLERYLADLTASLSPSSYQGHVSALNGFFRDTADTAGTTAPCPLPRSSTLRTTPSSDSGFPRAVAAYVMAQVEQPANLDRQANPRLPADHPGPHPLRTADLQCRQPVLGRVVTDAVGAPYLRYYNTKMKREALVPIDDELLAMISAQHDRIRRRWPDGTPVLFPRPQTNLTGTLPIGGSTYRGALYCWPADCAIRDEHGKTVRLTPHQWRHTLGTVLQPRRPAGSRPRLSRPYKTLLHPDDRALCEDHRPDRPAPLGAGHQGEHQRRAGDYRPGRAARPGPVGEDQIRHRHADAAQRLLRHPGPAAVPARQRLLL